MNLLFQVLLDGQSDWLQILHFVTNHIDECHLYNVFTKIPLDHPQEAPKVPM